LLLRYAHALVIIRKTRHQIVRRHLASSSAACGWRTILRRPHVPPRHTHHVEVEGGKLEEIFCPEEKYNATLGERHGPDVEEGEGVASVVPER
jgi:hypothetical protein